jgi:hypothetical protein
MAAAVKRDVTSEHCRGQEPQERRPVDHDLAWSDATCGVFTQSRALDRTGGAELGPVVPERTVAGRCVEAQADVARPSRGRLTQTWAGAATGRPEGGSSQYGRKVLRQRQRAPAQRADVTNDRIGNDPDAQRQPTVNL